MAVKKAKPAPKKPAVKQAVPNKKPAPAKKEEVNFRTYHLVKRADGKWEVKYAGGQKAIKLFDTQVRLFQEDGGKPRWQSLSAQLKRCKQRPY